MHIAWAPMSASIMIRELASNRFPQKPFSHKNEESVAFIFIDSPFRNEGVSIFSDGENGFQSNNPVN